MIEKEKFTEALDYMIQSPFVQKMLGSTSNDEDKLAREINQSVFMGCELFARADREYKSSSKSRRGTSCIPQQPY